MGPLQAIGTERWDRQTSERASTFARIAGALASLRFSSGRNGSRDLGASARGEREGLEIARLTGVYHEAGADPTEAISNVTRTGRYSL